MRATPLVAGAGLLAGVAVIPVGITTELAEPRGNWAVFGPLIGWSFIGAGLYAARRPPSHRFGVLLVITGFTWFLAALGLIDDPVAWALNFPLGSIWIAVLGHALLAFPSGRLESRAARVIAGLFYASFSGTWLLLILLTPDLAAVAGCDADCPTDNPFALTDNEQAAEAVIGISQALIGVVCVALCVLLARRWRAASPRQRRALAPVLFAGLALAVEGSLLAASAAVGLETLNAVINWALFATVVMVPVAFLAGLARSHVYRTGAVAGLVERLGGRLEADELRDALADALDDPSLSIAFWLPEPGRFVDAEGQPVELPSGDPGRSATMIEHDGRRVAALIHEAALQEEPELVRGVGAAASLALQNERLEAELKMQLDRLRDSRERLVAAGDAERRRLERDLHDGAQQRFVSLALRLRLARNQLPDDAPPAALIDGAIEELAVGLRELRELARGIHPAILTDQGLDAAVRGLVARTPTPVAILAIPDRRLPRTIETAAYFVIAEALTNVTKYACAKSATVKVVHENGHAVVEVHDDGVGGADPAGGSGLRGLTERVAALDGDLQLDSPTGRGTTLRVRFPVSPAGT
jgi:signal transduction histidine kinase